MFERILLPLDISEASEIALPYTEELAGKLGSEIILHYVRESNHEELEHFFLDYLNRLAETIKQNIKTKTGKEVKITTKVSTGEPSQNICELVTQNSIDLIVMTSVSVSGLKIGKTLGSVADHVCHTVPVPVMLLRPQNNRNNRGKKQLINKILIPLDGSMLSKKAVPVGEELAAKLNVPILLFEMTTMVYPSTSNPAFYGSDYVKVNERDEQVIDYNYAKANEAEESRVQAELVAIEQEIKKDGLSVDYRITSGIDAAKEIEQISEEMGVDLIVMATHGRSGLNRWLMGSVAEKILRYGKVPLLLINVRAS
jgi:nucleotide-binding universal stress UspA family protein